MYIQFRRLVICYIDFADSKGTFNYQKCREVFRVGARPVDKPETAAKPELEQIHKLVKTPEDSASEAAPASQQFKRERP